MSAIRRSARGQECTVRIPFVCLHDSETVVWAHANGSAAGKGIGMKSHDVLGAYACGACHNCYDRRSPIPKGYSREEIELMFLEGHLRSLQILLEKDLVRAA